MKKAFNILLVLLSGSLLYYVYNLLFFQTLYEANIKIDCPCKLVQNDEFINLTNAQSKHIKILYAYKCVTKDKENNSLININVTQYPHKPINSNISATEWDKIQIEAYSDKLKENNIYNELRTFNNQPAVEYEFEQLGIQTKALLFQKESKQYLIQIASNNNLSEKYKKLIDSFSFNRI